MGSSPSTEKDMERDSSPKEDSMPASARALRHSAIFAAFIMLRPAMAAAFSHLRAKGAFPEDEGDSDDEPCFGDDAFDNIDEL